MRVQGSGLWWGPGLQPRWVLPSDEGWLIVSLSVVWATPLPVAVPLFATLEAPKLDMVWTL